MHDQEWTFAMEEIARGRITTQQQEARARQTPTHWGSGGKAAWKDKYVSTLFFVRNCIRVGD